MPNQQRFRERQACRLTASQADRVDFARRDLDCARAQDLATLEHAALILLVERLRLRLDDVLQVIDEVRQP